MPRMTHHQGNTSIHPLGAVGIIVAAAGLAAWVWLGDWRWAITGGLALLALATVGAALDHRKT